MMPGLMMLWAAALIPGDSDADHQRRQQLKLELAAYSTSAQRRDLEAALDRYPDGVTSEIREILATQGGAMYNAAPGPERYQLGHEAVVSAWVRARIVPVIWAR